MKRNPFVGLRPYDDEDAVNFHGRDKEVENLLEIIHKNKLTALVGPPGSGKSSLINAGLIPRLKKGFLGQGGNEWTICKFRPGVSPIENLCYSLVNNGALTSDGKANTSDYKSYLETIRKYGKIGIVEIYKNSEIFNKKNLLIIIDQLEDIFRFNRYFDHETEGDDDLLLEIVSRTVQVKETSIYFLISIQSRYSGDLAQYIRLQEIISKSQYAIQNLGLSGVQEIIEKNFKSNKIYFDLNTAEYIKDVINSDLSLLPNAQYLFFRLYEGLLNRNSEKTATTVNMNMLNDLGGIENSFFNGLEKFYAKLSDAEKKTFEKILKALMSFENERDSEEYETIEKIAQISNLGNVEVAKFINQLKHEFSEAFELIPPKITGVVSKKSTTYDKEFIFTPNYESHLNWELKEQWHNEENTAYKDYKEYSDAAKKHLQEQGSLLISPALNSALLWKQKPEINSSWAKKYSLDFKTTLEFIDKSNRATQEKIKIEENRQQRAKKYNKRLIIGGFILIVVLSSFLYKTIQLNEETSQLKDEAIADREIVKEFLDKEKLIGKELQSNKDSIKKLYDDVSKKKEEALRAEKKAVDAEKEATSLKEKALIAQKKAVDEKDKADDAKDKADAAKEKADAAKEKEEQRKKFAVTESEFSELRMDLLYDLEFSMVDGEQNIESNSVDIAIEKYNEYIKLSEELEGEEDESSDLYLLLQTALGFLEGKDKYINTSMLFNKMDTENSSIRTLDVYDGTTIAFGGDDGKLKLVSIKNKQSRIIANLKNEQIRKVFISNEKDVFVGTLSGKVYQLNTGSNNENPITIEETTAPIRNIFYDTAVKSIIVVTDNEIIDTKENERKLTEINISASYYDGERLFFSDGSKLFFYQSGIVYPISINKSNVQIQTITAIDKNKNKLFLGTNSGQILIYTTTSSWGKNTSISYEDKVRSHRTRITKLLYDSKNDFLFSASLDNQVYKHNLGVKNTESGGETFKSLRLIGHEKWVWDLALVRDRNSEGEAIYKLLTADENGNLLSWYVNQDDLADKVKELANGQ